jgi:hypothetical protein
MNRTLITVLIALGSLVLGIAGTAGLYESTVVSRLQNQAVDSEDEAADLQAKLDKADSVIKSCQQSVGAIAIAGADYTAAYDANRDAVTNFFDRYNFARGDTAYLFAILLEQDDAMSTAKSNLSLSNDDVGACVDYSG